MTSLGLYYCFHHSRHTFNQPLTHTCTWLYITPHLCHSLLNLPNSFFWCFILTHLWFVGLRSGSYGGQSRRALFIMFFPSIQFLAFLEVCLGSLSYWKMCSSSPIPDSSKLGSKWWPKKFTYLSESILPSFSASFPASFQSIHPHTMMFLPQKFHCFLDPPSINPSLTYFHTHCFPSDPIVLVLVSYDQITLFQSSTAQSTASSHALQWAMVFSSLSQPWMSAALVHFWLFVERLDGH